MSREVRFWTDGARGIPEVIAAAAGFSIALRALPRSATEAVRDILDDRPTALLLDLDIEPTTWRDLIVALKQNAATRRVPIIGLSAQPDRWRDFARVLGCDQVLGRSQLAESLSSLLDRLAPVVPSTSWDKACREPLSAAAFDGIRLFNRGDYFEAHEALESAWNAEPGPAKALYRGLLQIAVAYHHVVRGNAAGARKVFLRMWQWLDPLPARCRGVDVEAARESARRAQRAVAGSTDPGLADVDRDLLQPWIITTPGEVDQPDRTGTQDHHEFNLLEP